MITRNLHTLSYQKKWGRETAMTTEIIKDIKWLIFDSGLTQKTISDRTGVDKSIISRIKSGKQPIITLSASTLLSLYDYAEKIITTL